MLYEVITLAAVKAGKTVLLANKEALVMSGALFMEASRASGAKILPVDSEHNAIFQCLPRDVQQQLGFCDLAAAGVHKILLTGSGGGQTKCIRFGTGVHIIKDIV